jgi:DNA-directed RNA polymerase specialized sigma24 family protein
MKLHDLLGDGESEAGSGAATLVARHESPVSKAYENLEDTGVTGVVETMPSTEEIAGMLSALPARQREALESLKLREMILTKASFALGRSFDALKVNAHRALKALQMRFQDPRDYWSQSWV